MRNLRQRFSSFPRILFAAIVVALALRALPALNGIVTGDVKMRLIYTLQFLRVPDVLHFFAVAKSTYHNPPLWIFVEALTLRFSLWSGISFDFLVKVWSMAADVGIILILWKWFDGGRRSKTAVWAYALNPVSILVTGFHGQFDPVVIMFTLLALFLVTNSGIDKTQGNARRVAAYFLLGIAIALKDYPVLILPFIFIRAMEWGEEWTLLVAALAPSIIVSLPFFLAGKKNFLDALFLYSGGTDFEAGGIGRLMVWMSHTFSPSVPMGNLPAAIVSVLKYFFLFFWGYIVFTFPRNRKDVLKASIVVFAGFLVIFPGISAQYLFWLVPLLIVSEDTLLWPYSLVASLGMSMFYLTYFPQILFGKFPIPVHAGWIPDHAVILYLFSNVALWCITIFCLLRSLKSLRQKA